MPVTVSLAAGATPVAGTVVQVSVKATGPHAAPGTKLIPLIHAGAIAGPLEIIIPPGATDPHETTFDIDTTGYNPGDVISVQIDDDNLITPTTLGTLDITLVAAATAPPPPGGGGPPPGGGGGGTGTPPPGGGGGTGTPPPGGGTAGGAAGGGGGTGTPPLGGGGGTGTPPPGGGTATPPTTTTNPDGTRVVHVHGGEVEIHMGDNTQSGGTGLSRLLEWGALPKLLGALLGGGGCLFVIAIPALVILSALAGVGIMLVGAGASLDPTQQECTTITHPDGRVEEHCGQRTPTTMGELMDDGSDDATGDGG